MPEIATSVRVTGKVQGVWFRGWTQETALSRGLRGWVRNEADGSVLALLIGSEQAVAGMLRALHDGPPAARVQHVQIEASDVPERPAGFEVLY
jgi:acylphosphatase